MTIPLTSMRSRRTVRTGAMVAALVLAFGMGCAWAVEVDSTEPAFADAVVEAGLSPVGAVQSAPVEEDRVIAKGLASWYGGKFHGRRTASGEIYDKFALTAAHKTLPFGTLVRVKSLRTGKEVVVRINDRGPYAKKRVIDLSVAAAAALGVKARGVSTVVLLRE